MKNILLLIYFALSVSVSVAQQSTGGSRPATGGGTSNLKADSVALTPTSTNVPQSKLVYNSLLLKFDKSGGNLSGALNETEANSVVSASSVDLSLVTGNLIHITGNTTITSFGVVQAGTRRTLIFDTSLLLTYNSTSLILPGNASILTSPNDVATFVSEGGGNWRCTGYIKNDDSYTNYTPTFTGYGTLPVLTNGDCRYKMLSRNTYHLIIYVANGVSNATTCTFTLPFSWPNISSTGYRPCTVYNNGTPVFGTFKCRSGSNVVDVYPGVSAASAFTASGNKYIVIDAVFQSDLQP